MRELGRPFGPDPTTRAAPCPPEPRGPSAHLGSKTGIFIIYLPLQVNMDIPFPGRRMAPAIQLLDKYYTYFRFVKFLCDSKTVPLFEL